ncbi:MAG: hypothetical protein WA418_01880 [Bradyrhizobium sp.]
MDITVKADDRSSSPSGSTHKAKLCAGALQNSASVATPEVRTAIARPVEQVTGMSHLKAIPTESRRIGLMQQEVISMMRVSLMQVLLVSRDEVLVVRHMIVLSVVRKSVVRKA